MGFRVIKLGNWFFLPSLVLLYFLYEFITSMERSYAAYNLNYYGFFVFIFLFAFVSYIGDYFELSIHYKASKLLVCLNMAGLGLILGLYAWSVHNGISDGFYIFSSYSWALVWGACGILLIYLSADNFITESDPIEGWFIHPGSECYGEYEEDVEDCLNCPDAQSCLLEKVAIEEGY